jgi:hypothetical protein
MQDKAMLHLVVLQVEEPYNPNANLFPEICESVGGLNIEKEFTSIAPVTK